MHAGSIYRKVRCDGGQVKQQGVTHISQQSNKKNQAYINRPRIGFHPKLTIIPRSFLLCNMSLRSWSLPLLHCEKLENKGGGGSDFTLQTMFREEDLSPQRSLFNKSVQKPKVTSIVEHTKRRLCLKLFLIMVRLTKFHLECWAYMYSTGVELSNSDFMFVQNLANLILRISTNMMQSLPTSAKDGVIPN